MADIFISYASEDRSRAETLAKALEEHDWSVWWDRIIPPGKTFDQVIQEAIDSARCVVVLWSKKSIKSDWVKEEANIGKERKILVPAKIDPVDLPIGFGRIQAADLTDWDKGVVHAGFEAFLSAISDIIASPPLQDKGEQLDEIPESNLGQDIKEKPKDSETFQPDLNHVEPVEKESPIIGPEASPKKRRALVIGSIILIVALSVISWFILSNKSQTAGEKEEKEVWGIQLPAYVVLDSAWETKREAQQRMVELNHSGYNNIGFFWIPDFKYLSGSELYQVYVGPFENLADAKSAICKYDRKFKKVTYGVKLSLKPGREEFRCSDND